VLLTLVWGVVWLGSEPSRQDSDLIKFNRQAELTDDSIHGEEAWTRLDKSRSYETEAIMLKRRIYGEGHRSLRILAIGDSFTVGEGFIDEDMAWPMILGRLVSSAMDGTSVDVVTAAQGGLSIYDYAYIAKEMARRDRGGLAIEPEAGADAQDFLTDFDVVIIGYYVNDRLPRPQRPGDGYDLVSVDERDEPAISTGSIPDPNQLAFEKAVKDIAISFKNTPILVLPLGYMTWSKDYMRGADAVFANNGLVVIKTPSTEALTKKYPLEDLVASQLDAHPGTAVHTAYARDAAVALEGIHPSGPAVVPSSAGYLVYPKGVNLGSDDDSVIVGFRDPDDLDRFLCARDWEGTDNVAGVWEVRCRSGQLPSMSADGAERPLVLAPCSRFKAPYAVVYANDRRAVRKARITVEDTRENFAAYAVGYDIEGFEVQRPLREISGGGSYDFELQSGEVGLAVVAVGRDCSGRVLPPEVDLRVQIR
jgi:hypothetical protein